MAHAYSNVIVQKEPKHKLSFDAEHDVQEIIDLDSDSDANEVIVIDDEEEEVATKELVDSLIFKEKPFACNLCSKRFAHKSNYYTHRKVHDPLRQIFTCEICGRNFLYKCTLKAHKLTHKNQIDIKCKVCQEEFTNEAILKLHEAVRHTEYPCEYCGLSFHSKSDFLVHKRSHKENVNSICSVCFRSFKYRNHLLLHVRSHAVNKIAKKNETRAKEVPKYMLVVTEDTKKNSLKLVNKNDEESLEISLLDDEFKFNVLNCEMCKMPFLSINSLEEHMLDKHPDNLFYCLRCQKGFLLCYRLMIHITKCQYQKRYYPLHYVS